MSESPTMKLLKKNKKVEPVAEAPPFEDSVAVEEVVEKPVEKAVAKKATKAKGTVEVLGPDLISGICKEVENLKSDEAIKMAHTLLEDVELNSFKLGGVLASIQTHGHWQAKGFETFKEFIESEFGLHYRKAMYLIQIYTALVNSGVSWEKVKELGWTKLKEIVHLLNEENVDQWVERAKELSTLNLIEYVKSADKGEPADETAVEGEQVTTKTTDLYPMTFKVHADQKTTIRDALDKKRIEINTEFDNMALESICLDYIGGTTGKKKSTKMPTLAEMLKGKPIEEVLAAVEAEYPQADISVSI